MSDAVGRLFKILGIINFPMYIDVKQRCMVGFAGQDLL